MSYALKIAGLAIALILRPMLPTAGGYLVGYRCVKPPVAILCGGRGARLQEQTRLIPKSLVEVGGRPIVWHVIQIYIAQGFKRFLLLTGYRGDQIEAFTSSERWPRGVEI